MTLATVEHSQVVFDQFARDHMLHDASNATDHGLTVRARPRDADGRDLRNTQHLKRTVAGIGVVDSG